MKLPIAFYGDPILRKKCAPVEIVDDSIRTLVKDMVDTMIERNGIGLAAAQVSKSLRIFITAVPVELPDGKWEPGLLRVFINPEILFVSKELGIREEACLSIPQLYGEVERPIKIKVKATDLDGNVFEEEFSGLEARCIMHENDHINGVLFIDRVKGKARQDMEPKLREMKKRYQAERLSSN